MKRIFSIFAALLLLGGVFAFTQAASWRVVKGHSITFSGKGVDGIFKKFDAVVLFDEANLGSSKLNVVLDVASLNTGNALQNKHATGAEWFDAVKYPKITFSSYTIEKIGSSYFAKGKMEVKNKIKDVTIPFSFTKTGKKGQFTSSFVIKRSDYGVGEPSSDVGDEIKIKVSVPVEQ